MAAMGDEVPQWCSSLPIARVTRWGGMISTPDALLQVPFQIGTLSFIWAYFHFGLFQTMIQTALTGSGCPDRLVSELMSNAHERRWPPGKYQLMPMICTF